MVEEKKQKWKTLTSGNVVKMKEAGDKVTGKFLKLEESALHKGSYVVTLQDTETEENKVVFVNNIVKDLIEKNEVAIGSIICIELTEWSKAGSGMDYKNFTVHVMEG